MLTSFMIMKSVCSKCKDFVHACLFHDFLFHDFCGNILNFSVVSTVTRLFFKKHLLTRTSLKTKAKAISMHYICSWFCIPEVKLQKNIMVFGIFIVLTSETFLKEHKVLTSNAKATLKPHELLYKIEIWMDAIDKNHKSNECVAAVCIDCNFAAIIYVLIIWEE